MSNSGDFSNFNQKINIRNKNIYFNTEEFSDFKDLLDCGYAEVNYIDEDGKFYTYTTCFYIPNNKMDEEFIPFLRIFSLDDLIFVHSGVIVGHMAVYGETSKSNQNSRILTTPYYEVIVQK